ncbi:MAG: hypothetical protein V1794_03320, partial [Candidatus Glassbacteria bacterium]
MKAFLFAAFCSLVIQAASQAATIHGKVSLPAKPAQSAPASSYSRGVYLPSAPGQDSEPAGPAENSYIVVWAVPVDQPAPFVPPKEKLEIRQQNKTFVPHVLPVQVGSTVGFPNLDPLYHNVFSYSHAKRFDLGRYQKGKSKEVTFDKAGIVEVYCEIHENMLAYIVVVDSPYFTRADSEG